MSVNYRADSKAVGIALTVINLILFIPLVILIVGCIVGTYSLNGMIGILQSAGAFIVLLFLLFLTAVIISQLFPNRRQERFKVLSVIIEALIVLVIAVGGLQLCLNSMGMREVFDEWDTIAIIDKCAVRNIDTFKYLAQKPQLYMYNSLQWFAIRAFGTDSTVMGIFMLAIYFLTAILLYRIARLLYDRVSSVITFAIAMFAPIAVCQTSMINVYSIGLFLVLFQLWIFLLSRRMARNESSEALRITLVAISAVVLGLAIFTEPSAFIMLLAEPLFICAFQRRREGENPDDIRMCIVQSVIIVLLSLVTFLMLMQVKANDLSMTQYEVFDAYLSSIFNSTSFSENIVKIWGVQDYLEPALFYNNISEYQIIYFAVLSASIVNGALCFATKEAQSLCFRFYLFAQILCATFSNEGTAAQYGAAALMAVMCGGTYSGIYSLLRKKAYDELQRNKYKMYEHNEEIQAQLQAMNEDNNTHEGNILADNYNAEANTASVALEQKNDIVFENSEQQIPEERNAEMLSAQDFVSFVNDDDIFDDDPLAGNSVVKIKTDEAPDSQTEDVPPDEGVITIDDVLGYDTDAEMKARAVLEENAIQADPTAFIENPLPIPPKHIDRELEFDIEVSDDDDFDIE